MQDVWAFVTWRNGEPEDPAKEALIEARRIADLTGGEVRAIVLDHVGDEELSALGAYGAGRVAFVDDRHLATYHPEISPALLSDAMTRGRPAAVLFPGTGMGEDLGTRVALLSGHRFLQGCEDIELLDGDRACAIRPVLDGRLRAREVVGLPLVAALKAGAVGLGRPDADRRAEVEALVAGSPEAPLRVEDQGYSEGDPRLLDLTEADVIVSGGRGLGGPEGFELLGELADLLGGSLAGSRPAVEAGWIPYERQVGQTGKTVRPRLYIACGISGAAQHLAGMGDAANLIAINTEESAPILAKAQVAVVGDLYEILPPLIGLLAKRRGADVAATAVGSS